jgi:hypothetical protein
VSASTDDVFVGSFAEWSSSVGIRQIVATRWTAVFGALRQRGRTPLGSHRRQKKNHSHLRGRTVEECPEGMRIVVGRRASVSERHRPKRGQH